MITILTPRAESILLGRDCVNLSRTRRQYTESVPKVEVHVLRNCIRNLFGPGPYGPSPTINESRGPGRIPGSACAGVAVGPQHEHRVTA